MSADFWAGYVSGAAGIVIGNPLDLIKVRLQAGSPSPSIAASPAANTLPYSIKNLFKGLPAPVLTYGALNALLFTTYNRSLHLFPPASHGGSKDLITGQTYPYMGHFTAGCIAGLATFVISAPTELIKCRAQVAQETSLSVHAGTSSWSIAQATWKESGIRGLYHGGVITSVRDAVGYGFYFLTYEACTDLWDVSMAQGERMNNGAAKVLLCGGLAGVATWLSIFPLDVIKTRVQTQVSAIMLKPRTVVAIPPATSVTTPLLPCTTAAIAGNCNEPVEGRSPGAWAVAQHAYKTEGIKVFFRGMTVCCVRAFIVNAVQWAVYEWMMGYLVSQP